jgi:hypothetical protein
MARQSRIDIGPAVRRAVAALGIPVLGEVVEERARQDAKWGEQNHPDVDQVLMTRPGGCTPQRMAEHYEIPFAGRAKFMTDLAAGRGEVTWAHIAVEELAEAVEAAALGDEDALRTEVVQLAAVCVQWVEALDRRGGEEAASDRALARLRERLGDDSQLAQDIRSGRLPLRQPGDPQSADAAEAQA